MMTTKHTRFVRNAVLALIPVIAAPLPVFADVCQNPEVKVINEKSVEMEVRKIKYFDGCDAVWRTENVNDTEIPSGWSATFDDDLEYVQNCPIVAFQLFRRVRDSNNNWTSVIWGNQIFPAEGSNVLCVTGAKYHPPQSVIAGDREREGGAAGAPLLRRRYPVSRSPREGKSLCQRAGRVLLPGQHAGRKRGCDHGRGAGISVRCCHFGAGQRAGIPSWWPFTNNVCDLYDVSRRRSSPPMWRGPCRHGAVSRRPLTLRGSHQWKNCS